MLRTHADIKYIACSQAERSRRRHVVRVRYSVREDAVTALVGPELSKERIVFNSVGDTLPHTVVGVCGEFQRTGRFPQRGI